MDLLKEIEETKQKLKFLEEQISSSRQLMYRISKGKHTFVLQPAKQIHNLKANGWVEFNPDNFVKFINNL